MTPNRSGAARGRSRSQTEALFDPSKPDVELFDTLAEEQAEQLEINSAQLRRFFGELKDLYRQFNARTAGADDAEKETVYRKQIEPRFKMIRSKVSYATRAGGQSKLRREFADFLQQGIGRVSNVQDFLRFVTHVEAVVGFMYGKGKVK